MVTRTQCSEKQKSRWIRRCERSNLRCSQNSYDVLGKTETDQPY